MLRPTREDLAGTETTPVRPMWPRNPWPEGPRPLSVPEQGPARILENSEVMTQWSPYGTFRSQPYRGGYDGLEGRLMQVAQADTYDASPNPWPNNGQYDKPNGFGPFLAAVQRESSAHRGFAQPTGVGPPMLFKAPPPYGMQVTPIPAVGI